MAEENEDKSLGFKWLKKRGFGGKKKDIQFYESFVYDGVEYTLYDCVYMYKEGYPEPYIGKLIKIWEHSDKIKKVKVQWFFYVWEILNYLGDTKALDKEIFLASGEGFGLANLNPLEAIAGKCNVVCVSKDSRNSQPSDEELKAADYIFYRTFDVQRCAILDKMDNIVGGLEIKYIFNRKEHENASSVPKLSSEGKEDTKNATGCDEALQLSSQKQPDMSNTLKTDGNDNQSMVNRNIKGVAARDVSVLLVRKESLPGVEPASEAGMCTGEVAATSIDIATNTRCKTLKTLHLSSQNPPDKSKNLQTDGKENPSLVKKNLKREAIARDVNGLLIERESVDGVKPASEAGEGTCEEAAATVDIAKTNWWKVDSNHEETKVSKVLANQVEVKERPKSARDSDNLKDRPGKKARGDNSIKDKEVKEKLPGHENGIKACVTTSSSEEKSNDEHGKNSLRTGKGVKSAKDSGDPEGRPSKKAKLDDSLKLSEDKNRNNVQKLSTNNNSNNAKDMKPTGISSEDKEKSRLALDSLGMKKGPNKEQPNEKVRKLSNGKLPKVSAIESADEDKETAYQEFEVTRRPDVDKSRWFREPPLEERLQSAYEHGALVLLQNLDPEYTSGEVEGIIWHAFKETCTAKMVQRTAISSPFSGQALIIFKNREAAERVMRKLDAGCLMLSNGRPVVGSIGPPPNLSGRQSPFFGHLVIDKIKHQMQREMKDAVSTSHCSQPNTIEYEMAMEWCALQSRSEKWWNKLYKQQREELKKLENNLKQK